MKDNAAGIAVSGRLSILLSVALPAAALGQAPPPSGFPGEAPDGPPPIIMEFEAEPPDIALGESVTLHWSAANAFSLILEPGVGTVPTRGRVTLTPSATTTFRLRVDGSGGPVSRTVTVAVAGSTAPAVTADLADAAQARPVPRLADGRPDLSGVYLGGRGIRQVGEVVLKPGADQYRITASDSDLGQGAECLPPGVPAATMMPYPLQIVHTPATVAILYEAYHLFRVIRIGQPHPEVDPTWMGHSVARWEGDTLVVDAIGFNDRTRIAGHRHTEAMHVVERYTRIDFDTIRYEATVEDPNVFAAPIAYAGDLVLHPEWEIGEYICIENNKDYAELFSD